MEDTERKLEEDADKLIAFGLEHEYVISAFFDMLGERITKQGYVDGSFVLKATSRGQYKTLLKDSKFQKL